MLGREAEIGEMKQAGKTILQYGVHALEAQRSVADEFMGSEIAFIH